MNFIKRSFSVAQLINRRFYILNVPKETSMSDIFNFVGKDVKLDKVVLSNK